MSTDLQTALSLLLIGMLSVFVILSLVVLAGRALIYFVNRWAAQAPEKVEGLELPESLYPASSIISKKKLAAITAAVDHLTHGKGHIKRIEKQ